MASKANLVIDQGSTFSSDLYLTDTEGAPLILSGYTASSQVRKWYTSANAAVNFTTFVNTTSAFITLSLTSTQTASLTSGRYVYDVEISDGINVSRVVEGIVTVTPQVTR
jgi:hypothetical protein